MKYLQLENSIEELNYLELITIDGGGESPWWEIAGGLAAIGLAVAAELGTAGLASVPAAGVASAGLAAVLHGASKL